MTGLHRLPRKRELVAVAAAFAVLVPASPAVAGTPSNSPGWIQAGGNVTVDFSSHGAWKWKHRYLVKVIHNRAMPDQASIQLRDAFIATTKNELRHQRPWPDDFFPTSFWYEGHRYTSGALYLSGATVEFIEIDIDDPNASAHKTKWRARVMVHFDKFLVKGTAA